MEQKADSGFVLGYEAGWKRTFCPQTGGTFMGMELKKTIVAADHRAQYDECVKNA